MKRQCHFGGGNDARNRTVILLCVFLLFGDSARAAGTTSLAFLRLGSGARAAALGDAFVSRADDASATYWNPAGLSRLERREVLAEHTLHVQDIVVNRLAYAHPFSNARAFGVSAARLSLDGLEARTGNTARPDSTFGASDAYAAVSYAHPLSPSASLGLTGKVIQQRLGSYKTTAYAADLGYLQRLGRFHLAGAVTNLGPDVNFVRDSYPLPRAVRGGVSYDLRAAPLTVSLEGEQARGESGLSYRFGMEYGRSGPLALRMGYIARPSSTQKALKGAGLGATDDGLQRFTGMAGGMGLRLGSYSLDYAFTPYGELGNAHKVSISAGFK